MQNAINSGDTAWVIIATALVMMMTAPALALFYGGMVRKKNILSTLNFSYIALAVISLQWFLWGYSFSFAPTLGGLLGKTTFL
jgi:Amt family ammonium transporter